MYKKLAIVTISAVYVLILIGGLVRASGSGMGCPDWPKCFGSWIPPNHVDQLPENYQDIFGAKLKGEIEFNAIKTWTEYINRLVGVLIGLLILATAIVAWKEHRKKIPKVVWFSFLALFLVVFEAWLGSKVVSTELSPALITIHMVLAIGIVLCLIYALFLVHATENENLVGAENKSNQFIIITLMVLSLGQLFLGTQVRELVDLAYLAQLDRESWVDTLGGRFYMHIFLAIVIVVVHTLFYINVRHNVTGAAKYFLIALVSVVYAEFISGMVLGLFNINVFAQPLHLTFASLIFGGQFILILLFGKNRASLAI